MLIFLAARAEITNQPKSKQIAFHRGDFKYHRFSINWFACPKGVKYKQISNKQAELMMRLIIDSVIFSHQVVFNFLAIFFTTLAKKWLQLASPISLKSIACSIYYTTLWSLSLFLALLNTHTHTLVSRSLSVFTLLC